ERRQVDPGHHATRKLVELRLTERPRELAGAVGAEVEVQHGVAVGHPVVIADDGGLDELVGLVPFVGLRDGGLGRRGVPALGVDDRVVCPRHSIPAAVAVHRVVAAAYGGDPPGVLEPALELREVAGARPGRRVAAVGERVHDEVRHALARGELDARLDVLPPGVDAAVGDQPHEMETTARPRAGGCTRGLEDAIVEEAAVGDRVVDARQVLLDDRAGAQVEMPHLGVPHLAVGQADVAAAGREGAMGEAAPELVEHRRVGLADGVSGPRGREPEAVEDDQCQRRDRDLARPVRDAHRQAAATAANSSGSRLAPPTSAPSIASGASTSAAFSGFTDPPYRIRTAAPAASSRAAMRERMNAIASAACSGLALRPVPMAQTGSYATT